MELPTWRVSYLLGITIVLLCFKSAWSVLIAR